MGPVAEALEAAAGSLAEPIRLSPERYRETRSVAMLVLADEEERAGRLARDLHERLERIGVYKPEARPWLPHVTVLRFRSPPQAPAAPARPRAVQSVRSRGLPFGARARRRAIRGVGVRSFRRLMTVDREEALETTLGQIERQFGKGSVMKMSDRPQVSIGAVSTGSLALDMALGIGGLPRGRVVEIFGPEASGKTTLVYHVIAEAQRRGGICAFIDAEHAIDPQYARRIGVNIDELLVSQPDTGEQGLEIAELLIRSGALDVVAVDSVAALVPEGRDRRRDGRLRTSGSRRG